MADESISGILTVPEAAQMGAQQGTQVAQGFDLGQQLQQQIMRTQAMQSDLQQKQIENHAAMINNLAGRMSFLAGADDDDKKGPMWKMQFDGLSKDMGSYGVQMNPDDLKNMLTDPTFSGKIRSSLQSVANAGLDPVKQAQVIQSAAYTLGRSDLLQNFPDEVQKNLQTQLLANRFNQRQATTMESAISKQVTGINEKFMTGNQYLDTAQNIVKGLQNGTLTTGQAENEFKLAETRAAQGGVPRATQLEMMSANRGWVDKLNGYFDKAASGKTLQPDELKDLSKIIGGVKNDANDNRLKLLSPIYNRVVSNGMTKENIFSSDDLDTLSNYSPKSKTQSAVSKAAPAPKGHPSYVVGKNKAADNYLRHTTSLGQANQFLKKYNMQIDQNTYNQLKGQ